MHSNTERREKLIEKESNIFEILMRGHGKNHKVATPNEKTFVLMPCGSCSHQGPCLAQS